jgi:hypothetical protein
MGERVSQGCELPPPGWSCSREVGHEGPCAAWPIATGEPGNDPFDPTDKVKKRDVTRLRIKSDGQPFSTIVEAYDGVSTVPLDVEAIAFELDCEGGRVTLSWPANAVDFDIDIRPLTPDERVEQMTALLGRVVGGLESLASDGDTPLAEEIRMYLKLFELGRR